MLKDAEPSVAGSWRFVTASIICMLVAAVSVVAWAGPGNALSWVLLLGAAGLGLLAAGAFHRRSGRVALVVLAAGAGAAAGYIVSAGPLVVMLGAVVAGALAWAVLLRGRRSRG